MPTERIATLDYWLEGIKEETKSPLEVSDGCIYTYSFMYRGEQQKVSITIPDELRQWAKRVHARNRNVRLEPKDFILKRISASKQKPVFDELLGELRRIQDHYHLDEDEFLELMVRFVQKAVWYDAGKRKELLGNTALTNATFYSYYFGDADPALAQRFPIETLAAGSGICLEKSMLLAALLSRAGYGTAVFLFRYGLHAAVGVRVPLAYEWGYSAPEDRNTTYAYIEPTEKAYVADNFYVEHEEPPAIIPVGSGKKEYQSMETMNAILTRKRRLRDLISSSESLKEKHESYLAKLRADAAALEEQLHELEKELAGKQPDEFEKVYVKFSEVFRKHDACLSMIQERENEHTKLLQKIEEYEKEMRFIMGGMDEKRWVSRGIEGDESINDFPKNSQQQITT